MAVIAFFLLRGHTADEMLSLPFAEKLIYRAVYRAYIEENEKAAEEIENELKKQRGGMRNG